MRIHQMAMTLAIVLLSACDKKPEAVPAPGAGANGMMGGTQAVGQTTQALSMMGAQLDSLGAMTPAQMTVMMPTHTALATQMMGSMGSEMRGMNMQGTAGWVALGDSVRQDLTMMAGLSGEALQRHMQSHIERMRRMMTMYQGMTRR